MLAYIDMILKLTSHYHMIIIIYNTLLNVPFSTYKYQEHNHHKNNKIITYIQKNNCKETKM